MASAVEFVIYFENPGVDVQVVGNQLRQLLEELVLRVYIMGAYGHWDIGQLEDPLGARFGGEYFGGLGVSRKKGNTQVN